MLILPARPSRIRMVALALAVAVAVACGGSDKSPAATGTQASAPPPLPTSAPGAPPEFAKSCASGFAWGVPLPISFVCFDEPRPGRAENGEFTARGYVAAPAGSTLTLEIRDGAARLLDTRKVEWRAAAPGVLSQWEAAISIPRTATSGQATIVALLKDPTGGSSEAQSGFDLEIAPARP